MPLLLHDPVVRDAIKRRVTELRPEANRHWGKMTVDQMLWHVNCALENALGRYDVKEQRMPLPLPVIKFIVLNFPWRKGKTPTAPEYVAKVTYDFAAERQKLLTLIDEITAKPLEAAWPKSSFMGRMRGSDWSRLHARHLDHHLSQFGA